MTTKTLHDDPLISRLLDPVQGPCLSILMPTHRTMPDAKQDPILLKDLCKEAEARLLNEHEARAVAPLLDELHRIRDSWDHQHNGDGLAIFVSQSGETADTLATLRYCKEQGQRIAAVVNVRTSTIARESDVVLPTLAGPEIGVASTKAFTCQLTALACFTLALGRARGTIDEATERTLVKELMEVPRQIADQLFDETQYEHLAHLLAKSNDVLYLCRAISFPLAM